MNKKHIKNVLLLAAISFMSISLIGQNSPHEFSVYAGGGIGTLTNKTTSAVTDKKTGFGGVFGVGYTYYVTSEFGLQTGLEYSMYNSKLKVPELGGRYSAIDNDATQESFDFQYKLNKYEEKQKTGYLQIPIMGQYLKSINDGTSFFVSAGVKVGFAINKSFDSKLATLTTNGYYPGTDVTIAEDSPDIGFGAYSNLKSEGDLKLKTAFLVSLETGLKWKVGETTSLYTGVYFDYGLNNLNKKGTGHLTEYNKQNPSEPILNTATQSIQADGKVLVDKITPMALGIKLRFAFGM